LRVSTPRAAGFDLLRAPVVGPFLRWRHSRTALQLVLLGAAALVILDGIWGPQLAPKNMAGILPWVHWRGLVALALLAFGNLFCMACPFMLTRRLAKKLLPAQRHWPKALRLKWLALILLFVFLWAYEAFDLWASPLLTAWLALSYFAAAFVIDGFFRGAPFCKYVCPIGQFHFVNSMASPFEVAIREADVCASCRTRDCIVGRYENPRGLDQGGGALKPRERGKLLQNGCELWLYQETKVGNMDCTFCMECIQACPYDNVGILARAPAKELWEDPQRAGVGRFSLRPDLAALAAFLTFAAFMNAFGMVTPVYAVKAWMARTLGTDSELLILGILFLAGMVVIPAILMAAAARTSAVLTGSGRTVVQEATVYAYALVPVGFGMWIAHYLFHFLIGGLAIVPAVQEYAADLGFPLLGAPAWSLGPMVPDSWLLPIELLFLELGLLVSLVVAYRLGEREAGPGRPAFLAALPWGLLALVLSVAGVWLLLQPMEMRGTLGFG
jgi:polyferredoxin